MDCDRVFFELTSRPFPSGSPEDSFVECHLLDCPSCRDIAEALRPSESVEHESLTAAERRGLPQYHAQLSAVPAAPSAMETRLHVKSTRHRAAVLNGQPAVSPRLPLDRFEHRQQLAAFSLAPRRRRNYVAEAATLITIGLLVGLGSWSLGWLAM